MDSPSPLPAPDPTATAAAQMQSNRETAITQAGLNATNQVTPNGTLTYTQSGTWPDGTPQYTATTALSPDQQNLYNLNNQTQSNIGNIGVDQSAQIGKLLNTPVNLGPGLNLDNSATEARTMQLAQERLDPLWAHNDEMLNSQLANEGLARGSKAYGYAQTQEAQNKNDAYNNLILSGHNQAVNDATTQFNTNQQQILTERNQPINEISALLSGSQVQQPNFSNTPQTGVAPTDVIGATGQSLGQGNVAAQIASANNNGLLTAGVGLAGAAAVVI